MNLFEELSKDNFEIYAGKHYTNNQALTMEDFHEDLSRLKYIKRIFRRYITTGDIQHRLALNHIITFFNVFDNAAAKNILLYKMDEDMLPAIKTILIYLNILGDDEMIETPLDVKMIKMLREL